MPSGVIAEFCLPHLPCFLYIHTHIYLYIHLQFLKLSIEGTVAYKEFIVEFQDTIFKHESYHQCQLLITKYNFPQFLYSVSLAGTILNFDCYSFDFLPIFLLVLWFRYIDISCSTLQLFLILLFSALVICLHPLALVPTHWFSSFSIQGFIIQRPVQSRYTHFYYLLFPSVILYATDKSDHLVFVFILLICFT